MWKGLAVTACVVLITGTAAAAPRLAATTEAPHGIAVTNAVAPADRYDPYRFLIGTWDVASEGRPAVAVAYFRWGPGESYIWHSMALLEGGEEKPHFEGMLVWNGARRDLDMLFVLDPLEGGGPQEAGRVSIDDDGTVVRHVTVTGASGATAHFRQTYKAVGPDRVLTALLRETQDGWVPTFPASDHLVMTRRSQG